MFKPHLTDSQRDFVVQCLDGSTLIELVRSSIQSSDLAGLHAVHRNGGFELAHLKAADLLPVEPDKSGSALHPNAHAALDSQALGMVNALGEVLRMRQGNRNFEIPFGVTKFVADRVNVCVDDIRTDMASGVLPRTAAQGPGLNLRRHLAGLACLAIALNDIELVGKIKRCDPSCLFVPLDGDLIQDISATTTVTPWGVAVIRNRLDILKANFDPGAINASLAGQENAHDFEDVRIDELMLDVSGNPKNVDMSIWAVRHFTSLEKKISCDQWSDDKETVTSCTKHASERLISLLCGDSESGTSATLVMRAVREVPEFYAKHLSSVIETCMQLGNNKLLAEILGRSVNWTHWDHQLKAERQEILNNSAAPMPYLPAEHPMGMVINSLISKNRLELDETMSMTLRVMVNAGQSDLLLRNDLNFDMKASFEGQRQEKKLPLSFEIAQMGMINSLEVMLSAGLDPALKFEGVSLMEACEDPKRNTASPSRSLMMLRAVHAQRQAKQAIDSVLSAPSLSF